jgi:hypothetical protein
MKKLILFSLLITIFLSCKNEKSTTNTTILGAYNKNISINYYLRTDNSDFVVAEIYARHEGDTIVPVIEGVSIVGEKMLQHKASRKDLVRFKFGEILPKTDSYEITVQPKGFDKVSKILTPRPITDFAIKEGKISKTNGFTITWKGEPSNETNETLVILITDAKGNSMSLNHLGNAGKNELFIDEVQLTYFSPGLATIHLVRKNKINPPRVGYIEENIELEHYTEEKKIEIVE